MNNILHEKYLNKHLESVETWDEIIHKKGHCDFYLTILTFFLI